MRFPSAPTDEQRALVESLTTFAGRRQPDVRPDRLLVHPEAGWLDVLGFGLLEHAASGDPGAIEDLVVACSALARAGIVVPITDACAGYPALADELATRVLEGSATCVVALGVPPSSPWGELADVVVVIGRDGSATIGEVTGRSRIASAGTLPWASLSYAKGVTHERIGTRILACHRLLSAATLCGLGTRMLEGAAAYARERRQFGRPLAEFQGVRHPLAECHASTASALDHTLLVATTLTPEASARALDAARQAALQTTYACQQVYGAMGYVIEGPMGTVASVVRDLALAEPVPTDQEHM